MRKIKFRAKAKGGEIVFGDLRQRKGEFFICEQSDENPQKMWQVDPETVVQLVGVDATGKEIYEGDAYSGFLTSQ